MHKWQAFYYEDYFLLLILMANSLFATWCLAEFDITRFSTLIKAFLWIFNLKEVYIFGNHELHGFSFLN